MWESQYHNKSLCSVCFPFLKYLIEVCKMVHLCMRNVATFKAKSRENFKLMNKWNEYIYTYICAHSYMICVQINIMFPATHYTLPVALESASGVLWMNSMTLSIILKVQGFSHFLGFSDHKVKTSKWSQSRWYVHYLNMKSHVSVLWEALSLVARDSVTVPVSSAVTGSSELTVCGMCLNLEHPY